ncbi:NEP1-interacting protein-like 1 [Helianthus annuus]|uniref:NEP1-interacting protein-like 1 n=1 Tax=Helianthus annuus TaxID=4232 RepID=UPI0016531A37|nr:NEP1-interacting protein-like 1 [Helianthus annuus]
MAYDSQFKFFCNAVKKVFMALVTCTVALGGATVGTIAGAIEGPTTETGLVRGSVVGAVTGAITALQLMDMIIDGEPFSKVSFLSSLVNGQVFADWVTPAVLKAYQSQINGVETTFADLFDACEYNGSKGLSEDSINELPRFVFESCCKRVCTICLQNFENKEDGRELTKCKHVFHLTCIDEWLIRNGSCPVCRRNV